MTIKYKMNVNEVYKLMILADLDEAITITQKGLNSESIDTKTVAENQLLILSVLKKLVENCDQDLQIKSS